MTTFYLKQTPFFFFFFEKAIDKHLKIGNHFPKNILHPKNGRATIVNPTTHYQMAWVPHKLLLRLDFPKPFFKVVIIYLKSFKNASLPLDFKSNFQVVFKIRVLTLVSLKFVFHENIFLTNQGIFISKTIFFFLQNPMRIHFESIF